MPRFIRIWEKKRGQRRTGSKLVGSLGEALFFGSLFVLGVVLMIALVSSRLLIEPEQGVYESKLAFWLVVLVLMSFILIGGSGTFYTIFHVGTSQERRSSLAKRAGDIELIRETMPTTREFPAVPRDANLTNSPGITLTYRLPIRQASAWQTAAMVAFVLAWNAITIVLAVLAIDSFVRGEPDHFLTLFVMPCVGIGVWTIYQFGRQLLRQTGIGPTSVEISDHPLLPAETYDVFVTQAGSLALKRLRMSLVCVEEASYTQGTDMRTESKVVHRQEIFRKEDFQIDPAQPFEYQYQFQVPEDAIHSFHSNHNAIQWRLVVSGKPNRWPSFERSFPVIVHPRVVEPMA